MSYEQEIFNKLIEKNSVFNHNYDECIKKVLLFIKSLDKNKIEQIDFNVFERRLLINAEFHDINLELVYEYARLCNVEFENIINEKIIESAYSSNTLLQYLLINARPKEDIITFLPKIMRNFGERDIDLLNKVRSKANNEDFYDESVECLTHSGDKRVVINSSLYYDNRIIEQIFESKLNMYFYIKTMNVFLEEEKKQRINKLCSLDNNELGITIDNFKKNIEDTNNRINQKIYRA